MTRVAVIGNTHRNIGAACAADLALAGHQVRYCLSPQAAQELRRLREAGGFEVQGDPEALVSGRTGRATLQAICDQPKAALEGAEVVLVDVEMHELERRFEELVPWLPQGALVHVQSYGYWAAARLTPMLRAAGRGDVLVSEAAAPTHGVRVADGVITSNIVRRNIEVATIPGNRIGEVLERLKPLFPDLVAAPSVLQTSLESVNLMVHPAMVLLGVGHIEHADSQGERVRFYRECNVPSAGTLAEAMDAERGRVCAAYRIRHRTLPAAIDYYYGTRGERVHDAVTNCAFYQGVPAFGPTTWRDWESVDVPYAIVPLVLLADQACVPVPVHRSMAELLGLLVGIDPWNAGPSLAAMDLVGSPAELAARYAGKGS